MQIKRRPTIFMIAGLLLTCDNDWIISNTDVIL